MDALRADQEEMQALLHEKKALIRATRSNEVAQQSIERSLVALRKNYDELKTALKWLDIADEYDCQDQATEVLRINGQAEEKAAECPFTAEMVRSIPLLNLQSVERAEFDNLVAGCPWTMSEDEKLTSSVQTAALRWLALEMHTDGFNSDSIQAAVGLNESSALKYAEPRSKTDSLDRIDWDMVASGVTHRNQEECRTRWIQICRTGVNSSPWRAEEIKRLCSIVDPYLARSETINWEKMAEKLDTHRTGFSCFRAYCRAHAKHRTKWTRAEDEQLLSLFELFGGAWRFISLHHLSARTKLQNYGRFHRSTDPCIFKGKWSAEEDKRLIDAVQKIGTKDWTGISAHLPGRTSNQCRERWVGRLERTVSGGETSIKTRRKKWTLEVRGSTSHFFSR